MKKDNIKIILINIFIYWSHMIMSLETATKNNKNDKHTLPELLEEYFLKHELIQETINALEWELKKQQKIAEDIDKRWTENTQELQKITKTYKKNKKTEEYLKSIVVTSTLGTRIKQTKEKMQKLQQTQKDIYNESDRQYDIQYKINSTITSLNYLLAIDTNWSEEYLIDRLTPIYRNLIQSLPPQERYVLSNIWHKKKPKMKNNLMHACISKLMKRGCIIRENRGKYAINTIKFPLLDKYIERSC